MKAATTKSKDYVPPEPTLPKEPNLVTQAAKRAIERAGDDVEQAVASFERSVRRNEKLRDAVLEPLVHEACHSVITNLMRIERRQIWTKAQHPPAVPTAQSDDSAQRVIHLATGTLLMFPLPGGVRLGDAMREQIEAAARFYSTQASDMVTKARWLDLVAKQVPKGKTAGEVLNDEQLQTLQREAVGA